MDLVEISKAEVIEKGRIWLKAWHELTQSYDGYDRIKARAVSDAEAEVLGAMVLLESREAMAATEHLDGSIICPECKGQNGHATPFCSKLDLTEALT